MVIWFKFNKDSTFLSSSLQEVMYDRYTLSYMSGYDPHNEMVLRPGDAVAHGLHLPVSSTPSAPVN